jgi:hypothetical protein
LFIEIINSPSARHEPGGHCIIEMLDNPTSEEKAEVLSKEILERTDE